MCTELQFAKPNLVQISSRAVNAPIGIHDFRTGVQLTTGINNKKLSYIKRCAMLLKLG